MTKELSSIKGKRNPFRVYYERSLYREILRNNDKSETVQKTIPRSLWFACFIIVLILLINHMYNDILITAKQGVNLWNVLISGRIGNFYELSIMKLSSSYYSAEQGAGYPFLTYVIMAIWNFPIWIVGKVARKVVVETFFAKVWIKMMLLLAYLLSVDLIYRIIRKINENKKDAILGAFFFASSLLIFMDTFVVSQIDILGVFFTLAGVYFWLEDKEGLFLLSFAIGIGIKYFPLLAFVTLIVNKNKNILSIIWRTAVVLAPSLFFQLIFGGSGNVSSMIDVFFATAFQMGVGMFLPFLFTVVFVVVANYLYKSKGDKRNVFFVIISLLLVYMSMRLFVNILPYWGIYIVPFLSLASMMTPTKRKEYLILETVLCAGTTFLDMIRFSWVYDGRLIRDMGLALKFFGLADKPGRSCWEAPNHLFTIIGVNSDYIKVIVYTIVLVCATFIVFYCSQTIFKEYIEENQIKHSEDDTMINRWFTTRFVANALVGLFPMIFHIVYTAL